MKKIRLVVIQKSNFQIQLETKIQVISVSKRED